MVSNGRLQHHHFGTPLPCGFTAATSERGSPFHSLAHTRRCSCACEYENQKPHFSVTQVIPPAKAAVRRFLSHWRRWFATAGRGVGFKLLLSCRRPSVRLSFSAFHCCYAPATARVPRGGNHRHLRPPLPRRTPRFPLGCASVSCSHQLSFSFARRLRYSPAHHAHAIACV